MNEIAKKRFGRTGHMSSRVIFGSVCLKEPIRMKPIACWI